LGITTTTVYLKCKTILQVECICWATHGMDSIIYQIYGGQLPTGAVVIVW